MEVYTELNVISSIARAISYMRYNLNCVRASIMVSCQNLKLD
jgi:hypothetical protein